MSGSEPPSDFVVEVDPDHRHRIVKWSRDTFDMGVISGSVEYADDGIVPSKVHGVGFEGQTVTWLVKEVKPCELSPIEFTPRGQNVEGLSIPHQYSWK